MSTARNILSTYLHFGDKGEAETIDVSDSFWAALSSGAMPELDQGRLMSAFSFSEPWATWERHPEGDELVMLLAGAVTLVLEVQGEEKPVALPIRAPICWCPGASGIRPGRQFTRLLCLSQARAPSIARWIPDRPAHA